MPRVLRSHKGRNSDYFCRKSGKTCLIVKAVDVTDLCPNRSGRGRVRIEYLQDNTGRKFVLKINASGKENGFTVLFPLEGYDPRNANRDGIYGVLRWLAETCGHTSPSLMKIIQSHAPPKAARPSLGRRAAARLL